MHMSSISERQILDVTYRDRVTNEAILSSAGLRKLSDIVTERRFCLAEDELRPARVAITWTPVDGKRKIGRAKMTWRKTFETRQESTFPGKKSQTLR